MISMNISPPREIADRNVESVPERERGCRDRQSET
jgi:hypothetical protein